MKNPIALFSLVLISTVAVAQQTEKSDNYPYWTISKDVQRQQYKDVQFTPATITTGNVLITTKGISRVHHSEGDRVSRTISKSGMPANVISKGVARIQFERSHKN